MRCIVFVSISVSHHGHFRGGRGALRVSRSGPPHSMRWQLAFSPAQLSNIVAPDFLLSLQIPVYHSLLNIGNSKYHRKQSCSAEIEEVGVATVLKPGSSLLLCCALLVVVLNGMDYGAIPFTATNKQASWMMEFSLSFESLSKLCWGMPVMIQRPKQLSVDMVF